MKTLSTKTTKQFNNAWLTQSLTSPLGFGWSLVCGTQKPSQFNQSGSICLKS